MRLYVCPISGSCFPVQLGLLAELCAAYQSKPDLVMASSGGNIAAFLTMASGWDPEKIKEIAAKLHAGMFAASWWPRGLTWLPSGAIGFFKGSMYADGSGATELFKECFQTKASVTDVEFWVGTLNRDTGKGQLFCNRSKDQCKIQSRDQDLTASYWSHDIEPLTYLDGNLDVIAQVAMASSSIPMYIPEKVINGQRYVDGGTQFASTLTPLQDTVRDLAEREHVHIDYVSSFNMNVTRGVTCANMYYNGAATISELVKAICVDDRLTAIEILRKYPNSRMRFVEYDGNQRNLQFIEDIRKNSPLSVLELYPIKNESVELLSFKGSDVIALMEKARKNYGLRFWYITPGAAGESLRASQVNEN